MNKDLDINSPRGRRAADDQVRAVEIVFGGNPEFNFIHTATDESAAVDGFIVKDWIASGVAEVKARDTTYETLMGSFKGEWLLTYQKLKDLACVAGLLKIPGYGLLYLTKSNMVLVLTLTNSEGLICCKFRVEQTQTQATCNGGLANRENAFISVVNAKIYKATA